MPLLNKIPTECASLRGHHPSLRMRHTTMSFRRPKERQMSYGRDENKSRVFDRSLTR